jgi:hypothetical protein
MYTTVCYFTTVTGIGYVSFNVYHPVMRIIKIIGTTISVQQSFNVYLRYLFKYHIFTYLRCMFRHSFYLCHHQVYPSNPSIQVTTAVSFAVVTCLQLWFDIVIQLFSPIQFAWPVRFSVYHRISLHLEFMKRFRCSVHFYRLYYSPKYYLACYLCLNFCLRISFSCLISPI